MDPSVKSLVLLLLGGNMRTTPPLAFLRKNLELPLGSEIAADG